MRDLLQMARKTNSRLIAAAIGAHLSKLETGERAETQLAAADAVRDASFQLLKALHRGKGVKSARLRALRSVDHLAVEVARGRATQPVEARPSTAPTLLGTFRLAVLGRFAQRLPQAAA